MNHKNLRIGNLLQDQNGNQLVVIGLNEEDVSLYVVDRSKFPLPGGWKPEGIPLTRETFKKLGGVDFPSGNAIQFENRLFNYAECRNVFVDQQTMREITFVHTLQNFIMVMTEKEIPTDKIEIHG